MSYGALSLKSVISVTAAAAAAPLVVQTGTQYTASGTGIVFGVGGNAWNTPTAGNLLYVKLSVRIGSNTTLPAGWTVVETGNPTAPGGTELTAWKKAAGTESSVTFGTDYTYLSGELFEISGADTTNPIHLHALANVNDSTSPTVGTFPTLTPTIPYTLAIGGMGFNGQLSGGSASTGWTVVTYGITTSHQSGASAYQAQGATLSAVNGSITQSSIGGVGSVNLVLIKPK